MPRALIALHFGLEIHDNGFNLYVAGSLGIGKIMAVHTFAGQLASAKAVPPEWCYVNNFDTPYQPKGYQLPPGHGRQLQLDLQQAITQMRQAIPTGFESETYMTHRDEIGKAPNA